MADLHYEGKDEQLQQRSHGPLRPNYLQSIPLEAKIPFSTFILFSFKVE